MSEVSTPYSPVARLRSRISWASMAIVAIMALAGGSAQIVGGSLHADSLGYRAPPEDPSASSSCGVPLVCSPLVAVEPAHGSLPVSHRSVVSAASSSFLSLRTVPVGAYPSFMAYDSAKGEMFIANSGGSNVSVYSDALGRVVASVTVGPGPFAATYDSGKGEIFVSVDHNVSIISDVNNSVVGSVNLGGFPFGLAYDSGKGEVFVANLVSNVVSVISDTTNSVVATVPAHNATLVAYDSGRGEIFVSNGLAALVQLNGVYVISDTTNTVVATVTVGSGSADLAYDPAKGVVFVANLNSNNVSVISDSTNKVAASIPVGVSPVGVAYDPRTADILVANSGSSNVSVIADLNYTVVQSVGNLFGAGAEGEGFDSGTGAVFVADANVNAVTIIVPGYIATISESGLPAGTQWNITLNGSTSFGALKSAYTSTTSTISAGLPNGTFTFSLPPVPSFLAAPGSGTIRVSGGPANLAVTFRELFAVKFSEAGLAAGTNWSVTLNGSTSHSTTPSITMLEINGTYPFTAGLVSGFSPIPSSGSVTVSGASKNVALTYAPLFAVTFTETGLPTGTNWSVTVVGMVTSSVSSSIALSQPNGTYVYTLGTVPGWTTSNFSGAFTVSGSAVSKIVAWQRFTYTVTFLQTGLPLGTSWSVTFGSVTQSGTGDGIAIAGIANGTYAYTVNAVTGYSPAPSTGSVSVSGPPAPVAITYKSTASASPMFLGLPSNVGYALLGAIVVAVVGAGLALFLRRRRTKPTPEAGEPSRGPPRAGSPPSSP